MVKACIPLWNKNERYCPDYSSKLGTPQLGISQHSQGQEDCLSAVGGLQKKKTKVISYPDFKGQKLLFASQPDRKRGKWKWLYRCGGRQRYTGSWHPTVFLPYSKAKVYLNSHKRYCSLALGFCVKSWKTTRGRETYSKLMASHEEINQFPKIIFFPGWISLLNRQLALFPQA